MEKLKRTIQEIRVIAPDADHKLARFAFILDTPVENTNRKGENTNAKSVMLQVSYFEGVSLLEGAKELEKGIIVPTNYVADCMARFNGLSLLQTAFKGASVDLITWETKAGEAIINPINEREENEGDVLDYDIKSTRAKAITLNSKSNICVDLLIKDAISFMTNYVAWDETHPLIKKEAPVVENFEAL